MKVNDMVGVATVYLHTDELPWVTDGDVKYRIFQWRADDKILVGQYRLAAGVVSPLHRHLAPAMLYTISGDWGHRPDDMEHRTGTYVYEPTGAVHRYYGGPSEQEWIYTTFGDTEVLSDDGQVDGLGSQDGRVRRYFELCEAQGLPRPKLLS